MYFQKWNLGERGFAYKPMSQVLACLCSCTSPLFSPWMSGLHPQEEQLDPARDHCPAPPGLHAQGWKGTQWLLIPSSQQGPPTVSTWMILHFDNFIVITRAESKFNSPGVWIWTVSHLQSQIQSKFGWGSSEWQRSTVLSHKGTADWGATSRGLSYTLLFQNGNALIAYFIFMTL